MTVLAGAETWWANEAGNVGEECSRSLEQRFASQAFGTIYQDSGSAWSWELDPARRLGQALGGWAGGQTGMASRLFAWNNTYVGSPGCFRVSTAMGVCCGRRAGREAGMAGLVEAVNKSVALSPHSFGMEWRVPDSRARSREVN